MAQVTFYTQPGCYLCEKALCGLTSLQAQTPSTLEEVNIQSDPALQAEYGEQIPVVLLNGDFLFECAVDENQL